jgi:hypothetical protein
MSARAAASPAKRGSAEPPEASRFLGIRPNARARHQGAQTGWVPAALPLTAAAPSSIPPLPGPKAPRGDPALQKGFQKGD